MNVRTILTTFYAVLFVFVAFSCKAPKTKTLPVYDQGVHVIPVPMELTEVEGEKPFVLGKSTSFVVNGEEAKTIAEFIVAKMRKSTGLELSVREGDKAPKGSIYLALDANLELKNEGYTLHSTHNSVQIIGKTAHGLWNGVMTLLQLLPAEIESPNRVDTILWEMPAVSIKDEPRFKYRGVHLDPSRHFLTVEDVKRQIDVIALFKINRLHWHLTDDQGWRIEIKKYPKLTETGSKRIEGDGTEYGGFYTQEDIKEVVEYAQKHFITIVPEIEMPGHAMAALTAYPELACFPREFKVRNIWGVEPDVYCAGKEEVFAFIEDVIAEVAPLFPGEYFHIGGDECPKDRWEVCPNCKKRMQEEKLKNTHELQSYFVQRAGKILEKHGKRMIGWDEILEGGLAPSATVMSWRGEDGGIEAANMNHNVIMTPNSGGLYIDHYQGDSKIEPVAIGGYSTLNKVYSYEPLPEKLNADKHQYIMGAQCNLWSEYFYTTPIMEYRAYPRAIALAEVTWSAKKNKDFENFCKRLDNAFVRLDHHKVNYHIPLPEQPNGSINFVAFIDETKLELKTTRPVKMVYALGEEELTANSTEYTEPIAIKENTIVKTASVLPSGKLSEVRTITFEKQQPAASAEVENKKPGLHTQTIMGDFYTAMDIPENSKGTEGVIKGLNELINDGMKNSIDEVKRKAVIATGYVMIPKDGVYYFSTNNDQFWIDGVKLIDNGDEVKKFSRHDSSRALKAGLHPIKIVWVGAITGGWPTYWNDGSVSFKMASDKDYTKIGNDMLFF